MKQKTTAPEENTGNAKITRKERNIKLKTAFRYAYEYSEYHCKISHAEAKGAEMRAMRSVEYDCLNEMKCEYPALLPPIDKMIRKYDRWAFFRKIFR